MVDQSHGLLPPTLAMGADPMSALGHGHLGRLLGQVLETLDPLGLSYPRVFMGLVSHAKVSLFWRAATKDL